jgi:hypothetical protein
MRTLALLLVLALGLLPAAAFAEDTPAPQADMSFAAPPFTNDAPERAIPFNGAASGDLEAVPPTLGVGKYAFFSFYYPGDNSTVTIGVDFLPGDPSAVHNAGFKVYGPTNGKLYATGGQTGKHPSYEAAFASTEAGTYLLQVSNANLKPIHYEATATGLPAQPTPTPTPPAPAAPAPEDSAAPRILTP